MAHSPLSLSLSNLCVGIFAQIFAEATASHIWKSLQITPGNNKYCQYNIEFQPRENEKRDRGINVIFDNFRFSLASDTLVHDFLDTIACKNCHNFSCLYANSFLRDVRNIYFITKKYFFLLSRSFHRPHPMTIRNLYGTFHETPIRISILHRSTD